MDERRIAELFRQHAACVRTAGDARPIGEVIDEVCAALERRADPVREGEPLDRVLASNEAAAIARVAAALAPAADELSQEVAALRRERSRAAHPWRQRLRPVVAMAAVAGLAAMAVLVSGVTPRQADAPWQAEPVAQRKTAPEDIIKSVSFESEGVASVSEQGGGAIFRGDFDS